MRARLLKSAFVLVAGLAAASTLLPAQEPTLPEGDSGATTPTTPTPETSTPAPAPASSFGSSPSDGTAPTTPAESPAGSLPTPGFSTSPLATTPGALTLPAGVTAAEAATFTLPGGYGQAPQTFVAGQGRLARPHFQYSGAVSFGYDDNTLSVPFNAVGQKAVTERVQTQEAIPAHLEIVPLALPRGGGPNSARPYYYLPVPAQEAKFKDVVVAPAVPAPKVEGSFAMRANAAAEVQFASRRTVFTMDLRGSATDYLERSRDPLEYNGSLALTYLHRITPRLQFSASFDLAYLTQPDLTRVNAPTGRTGDYFNGNGKFDLSYRWSPRFSTVSTLSVASQLFADQTATAGDFYQVIFGTEGRWQVTRRLILTGEARYGETLYSHDDTLNSSSVFLLAGGEITLTRRLQASLRAGEELRTFEQSGQLRTSPYVEATLSYQYNRAGVVNWNSRIGFESPGTSNSTNQVFRSSLSAIQAFSARTRGSLGLAAVHQIVTDDTTNTRVLNNSFQIDAGLEYTLSKHATFTADYTFIGDLSSQAAADYVRNQLFIGVQYAY